MLSENLLYYRKRLKLSQEEIAGMLGVSRQAYAKWEAGETTPELKHCMTLSRLFEITLDELTGTPFSREEGPAGKYLFGIVSPDEKGQITLPPEALRAMDIQPGDRYLLLGDTRQGLALVPYTAYERFARDVLRIGEDSHD